MPPTAITVEALEPVMAPKRRQVMTAQIPNPPGKWPTRVLTKRIRREVTPPRPMRSAARIKNGMAKRANPSTPANMRWGRISMGIEL